MIVVMGDVLNYIRLNPGTTYQKMREHFDISGIELDVFLNILLRSNDIFKLKVHKHKTSTYKYFATIQPEEAIENKNTGACSHLLDAIRLKTGIREYYCTAEEDFACSCAPDGWCPLMRC